MTYMGVAIRMTLLSTETNKVCKRENPEGSLSYGYQGLYLTIPNGTQGQDILRTGQRTVKMQENRIEREV